VDEVTLKLNFERTFMQRQRKIQIYGLFLILRFSNFGPNFHNFIEKNHFLKIEISCNLSYFFVRKILAFDSKNNPEYFELITMIVRYKLV
jgi:hypothetical protein